MWVGGCCCRRASPMPSPPASALAVRVPGVEHGPPWCPEEVPGSLLRPNHRKKAVRALLSVWPRCLAAARLIATSQPARGLATPPARWEATSPKDSEVSSCLLPPAAMHKACVIAEPPRERQHYGAPCLAKSIDIRRSRCLSTCSSEACGLEPAIYFGIAASELDLVFPGCDLGRLLDQALAVA